MKKRKAQRGKPAKMQEPPSAELRVSFYSITVILALLIILFTVMYAKNYLSYTSLEVTTSIAFSLFLPFAAFSYMIYKGRNIRQILGEFGLTRDRLTFKAIAIGAALFFAVILLGLVLSAVSSITNIPLPTNVQSVLGGTPLYFMVFAFLIAPIDEEIFFRAFLITRINTVARVGIAIVISAFVFALFHLSYLSISEFVAAFVFGIMAGYVFDRTKSLYPSIVGHMLVNLVTVTSLVYMGMLMHI